MLSTSDIIDKIEEAFRNLNIGNINRNIISNLSGKAFELYSLTCILEELDRLGYTLTPQNLRSGRFRAALGPSILNRNNYSYISIQNNNHLRFEIWMDIEYIGISGGHLIPDPSYLNNNLLRHNFAHEIDIAIIDSNVRNGERPYYHEIKVAAECKITKNFG